MRRYGWKAAGLVLAVVVIAAVQYAEPFIIGADGNFHSRMAILISRQGFLHALPQAHFSWFATRFSDKDFLYHLFLIPFVTVGGYTAGAKAAATVAFSVLAAVTIWLAAEYSVPQAALVASVMFILSGQFLRDMSEARPFVLAVALTLVGIHVIIRKRSPWVFAVALVYGLLHLSAWALGLYAILWGVSEWLRSGRYPWRTVGAAAAGYAISFFIHPNFPNNIFFAYLNGLLVPWYAFRGGVLELGAEFFPMTTHDLLNAYPLLVAGTPAVMVMSFWRRVRLRRYTVGWGAAVLLYGFFGLIAKRNLAHVYPIFIIFLLSVYRDFRSSSERLRSEVAGRLTLVVIPAIVCAILFSGLQTLTRVHQLLLSDSLYSDHFARVAAYLRAHVPPGSRIFHTNWSDSQYLIGDAPEYEYLVTMDPIYMYSYNPALYALYRNVSFGQNQDPYHALHDVFGTMYGYAGKNYFSAFIDQIRTDTRFRIMAEDDLGVVFALQPDHQPVNAQGP